VNWVTGIEVYVSSGLSRDGSSTSASGRTSDMDIWRSREFGPERAGKFYCFALRCEHAKTSKYVRDNLREVTFDPKNKLRITGSSRGLNGKGGKTVGKRARAPDE
jgi:hypothetical protein